jgi:O-antigen/teichoic acid export membrane protein
VSAGDATSVAAAGARAKAATRKQIRGSSLLLAGRLLSKGANLAIQVLIVRHLAKEEFGAFAYGLSVVMVVQTFVTFGLDRAVTRFVPIHHERGDFRKVFGTFFMVVGSLLVLGVAAVASTFVLFAFAGEALVADPLARALLLILIFLAPIDAVDAVLVGMFAVFAKPRAIFARRYLLAPVLRLGVVLTLVVGGFGVQFLAAGYVAASLLGVLLCTALLVGLLREEGLLGRVRLREIEVPWRPVLAFTLPLLSSDLLFAAMHVMDTILLEHFHGTSAVAGYRAVYPAAHLNTLIFASFGTLFTPLAARMFARGDRAGIDHLYWQTAVWIAVLSFPIFAVTCSLAGPVTVLLFGDAYRDSAVILAILAVGQYANAATGMNGLTLKVYGKLRYVFGLNLATLGVTVAVNWVLIPPFGALGAAVGTSATLLVHNLLKQVGVGIYTGVRFFDPHYLRVYALIAASATGLFAVQRWLPLPLPVALGLAALASFVVLRGSRRLLDVEDTLPELARIPLLARLLGRTGS